MLPATAILGHTPLPPMVSPEGSFRTLVHHSPDIVAIADGEGRFQYSNPAVEQVLGYSTATWQGKSAVELIHPEDVEAFEELLWNVLQHSTSLKVDLRLQHCDGGWREFEVVVNNLLAEPEVQGLVFTCHDIHDRAETLRQRKRAEVALRQLNAELQALMEERTNALRDANSHLRQEVIERIQAQKALQESQERLHLAVTGINDGIWDWNLRANSLYLSPVWFNILGYSQSDLPESFDAYTSHIHPDNLTQVLHNVQEHLDEITPVYRDVYRIQHKEGHWVWIEVRGRCVRDKVGRPYRFLGTATDISDRQRIEAERKQTEEKLQASLNEKELLLKEVHHRVKNNMQVISSIFSLQSQYIQDPGILSILTDSKNRIRSMALIHEKLYQSTSLAKIDFREYIQNLASHLFASYDMSWRQVCLDLQVADVSLNLDTAIPCGLLLNELVSNSLKHAFPNNRSGELKIHFHQNQQGELSLVVQDNGIGLPDELNAQTVNSLGLRLVHALTRQLRGRLEILSQQGATFKVTFPQPD
jgi:PAS domain S-box-containing protein